MRRGNTQEQRPQFRPRPIGTRCRFDGVGADGIACVSGPADVHPSDERTSPIVWKQQMRRRRAADASQSAQRNSNRDRAFATGPSEHQPASAMQSSARIASPESSSAPPRHHSTKHSKNLRWAVVRTPMLGAGLACSRLVDSKTSRDGEHKK